MFSSSERLLVWYHLLFWWNRITKICIHCPTHPSIIYMTIHDVQALLTQRNSSHNPITGLPVLSSSCCDRMWQTFDIFKGANAPVTVQPPFPPGGTQGYSDRLSPTHVQPGDSYRQFRPLPVILRHSEYRPSEGILTDSYYFCQNQG